MLSRIKTLLLITLGFMPLAIAATPAITYADAQSQIQSGVNEAAGTPNADGSGAASKLSTTIKNILDILSAVAGVAAVAMIIVAGVRFTASAGNENAVKGAKSAIIYAVIGIVLVATAQIIVHFVITNVSNTG